jgi:hypothetical protein
MSDTSKNKDNSSDGGDEAKKMVLRSATNSIRNKKWSEDVDEAEYEVDSDGEDTDYGNSSRRGESRARETRKGGRAISRQTNAHYNTRSRNPRYTRKDNADQDDSFEEAEPKSMSTSGSRKRTRASIESKPQDSAANGSDESAFEEAAVSSLLGLAEASIFLLDQREPKRQKTEGTKESKKADSTRSPDQSLVSPAKGREEKKKPAQSPTSPTATTTPVKQQTQGEELYDFETARNYVTAPPHFTALKGNGSSSLKNINPNITFNGRQRNYRRCSTHVAIAYYIFYHQKYSFLTAPPNVNFTQKYLQPFSLDPTYEARVAKERSEHFRRLMAQQQQQSAMMPSYPPPPYGHPALAAMPPQMMPGPGPMPGYPVPPPMAPMYSTAPNPAFPYMQSVPQPSMRPNLGMEPKLETVPLPPIKTEDANKLNNNILPPLSSLDIDKSLLSPKKEDAVSPMKPREESSPAAIMVSANNANNVNTNGGEVTETNGHATTQTETPAKND